MEDILEGAKLVGDKVDNMEWLNSKTVEERIYLA